MAKGERTVADIFGSAGWETHMIGKWVSTHRFFFAQRCCEV